MPINQSLNPLFMQVRKTNVRYSVRYIHSEELTDENVAEKLKGLDGVLVAPGFGSRGIEGKIVAITLCPRK